MVREQGRLLRDRADRDIAIGRRLDRGLLRRLNRRGDRGERCTLDIAGRTLRRGGGGVRAICACSMPVATTETRMMPSSVSSKVAPTMILAS
jgi:hypothetical protein